MVSRLNVINISFEDFCECLSNHICKINKKKKKKEALGGMRHNA